MLNSVLLGLCDQRLMHILEQMEIDALISALEH